MTILSTALSQARELPLQRSHSHEQKRLLYFSEEE
jgi:hypothetical protein